MKTIKITRLKQLYICLTVTVFLICGCASQKTTTVSTTEVRRESSSINDSYAESRPVVVVTKSEEVSHADGHKGFFGILGDIIALPFRALFSIL